MESELPKYDTRSINFNVTSNIHQDKRTVNINIHANGKGFYNFKSTGGPEINTANGFYYPDYLGSVSTAYPFVSCQFEILEVDTTAKTFKGSFSGKVLGGSSGTDTITIINGSVSGNLVRY